MMVVTTVFLCTSKAAQHSWMSCMGLLPVLVLTLCFDNQREVRKNEQLSSACSPLAGGNILLCWTHLDRLPPADSRYQRQADLCLLITSPFYPIFIPSSGSQSHHASPETRLIYTKCIKSEFHVRWCI